VWLWIADCRCDVGLTKLATVESFAKCKPGAQCTLQLVARNENGLRIPALGELLTLNSTATTLNTTAPTPTSVLALTAESVVDLFDGRYDFTYRILGDSDIPANITRVTDAAQPALIASFVILSDNGFVFVLCVRSQGVLMNVCRPCGWCQLECAGGV
jgi:hypothetical protein